MSEHLRLAKENILKGYPLDAIAQLTYYLESLPPALTEEKVREIVREEMKAVTSAASLSPATEPTDWQRSKGPVGKWVVREAKPSYGNPWWNVVRENDDYAEGQLGAPWGNFHGREWAQATDDRVNALEAEIDALLRKAEMADEMAEELQHRAELGLLVLHKEADWLARWQAVEEEK
jgi:hypothetical protein